VQAQAWTNFERGVFPARPPRQPDFSNGRPASNNPLAFDQRQPDFLPQAGREKSFLVSPRALDTDDAPADSLEVRRDARKDKVLPVDTENRFVTHGLMVLRLPLAS
jgi:hypothetical protein